MRGWSWRAIESSAAASVGRAMLRTMMLTSGTVSFM